MGVGVGLLPEVLLCWGGILAKQVWKGPTLHIQVYTVRIVEETTNRYALDTWTGVAESVQSDRYPQGNKQRDLTGRQSCSTSRYLAVDIEKKMRDGETRRS